MVQYNFPSITSAYRCFVPDPWEVFHIHVECGPQDDLWVAWMSLSMWKLRLRVGA